MAVNQRVADEQTILIVLEEELFLQDDTTYTVDGSRNLVTVKLPDVLVTIRTVMIALILMQAKVKLGTMLYDCTVE